MARRSIIEVIFKLATEVPWWLSVAMGGAFYYTFMYYVPAKTSENMQSALTPMFEVMAYGFLGICLAGTATSLFRGLRNRRLFKQQTSIRSIRELSWLEFELFVLEAYRRQGYTARATDQGADGGVDVVLSKDGWTTLVQCKQWKTQRVGVKPVRELAGVVAADNAHAGVLASSGSFTKDARRFATSANLELVDGKQLEKLIKPVRSEYDGAMPLQQNASSCPKCGSALVRRTARKGRHVGEVFLGCASFPKCRYIKGL